MPRLGDADLEHLASICQLGWGHLPELLVRCEGSWRFICCDKPPGREMMIKVMSSFHRTTLFPSHNHVDASENTDPGQ